tara:strand:- start:701 stop:2083 length:1383 start_codon:yes stop_codon:yes gene_type:complete
MTDLPATLPEKADMADRLCKKIQPQGRDIYLKDPKVTGLVFRVTPNGKKTWQVRYTVEIDGKWQTRKTSIGGFDDGMGTNAARAAAETLRGNLRGPNKIDPLAEKQAKKEREAEQRRQREQERLTRITMQDVFDEWLRLKLKNPKNGHKDGGVWAGGIVQKHILQPFGTLEVKRFGVAEFNRVIDPLIENGNNRMANVVLALAKQMMGFAVARNHIQANPLDRVSRADVGGTDTERDRLLCSYEDQHTHEVVPDELAELFRKLPTSGLPEASQIALHLVLSTVCRIGELLKARWADVDLTAAEWRIPAENSKNGLPHLVNLSPYALAYMQRLQALNGDSEWLFPARRATGHIDPKTVTKQVADRQREADGIIPGRTKLHDALLLPRGKWTPHDLRRSGATLMGELGVMGAVIEKCLNHVEENRVKRTYNRHTPREAMKQAWLVLGEELERLAADAVEIAA